MNEGIEQFLNLSKLYKEMRSGFIELMMDSRSPVRKMSEGKIMNEKEKVNSIMYYMNQQKQWTNSDIGAFFGFETNSVVNRLTKIKLNLKKEI